ncbi:hypothetical protein [Nocardioides sp.]|uniref:hypothetical protein n=1 Tax=Nocardioides sp. TaxID=35761 RepID=UPI0039E4AD4A
MSDERTRLQQVGPWIIGVIAIAALLVGVRFVPAEAGPGDAPDSAPPTQPARGVTAP